MDGEPGTATVSGPWGSTAGWATVMNMGRLSFSDGAGVFDAGAAGCRPLLDDGRINPHGCGQFRVMPEKYAYIQALIAPL
jgi:hypothetical protein